MTYLQRIEQLDKKLIKAREKLLEIEMIKRQNKAQQNKQMEIDELEHLKTWYNERIVNEFNAKKFLFCRVYECKYYLHGKCFLSQQPIDNDCVHKEAE